jgi:hypothetical protein
MSYLHDKIDIFYKKHIDIFKAPLEKIIDGMLKKCEYINGESLERHNWGNKPVKLKNIPKNLDLFSFEADLLNALDIEDNEKSIVELLWGDIQLGKRVQACIIMWISVHILNRPVLYIFRNLTIDQTQLQQDISGTENYNFNIQFIKNIFDEFNNEIQLDYYKFRLPNIQAINSDSAMINDLSNKNSLYPTNIYCCLMNHVQLAKINNKFSEYIYHNDELVNITVLVDESDLMSPTSSNDKSNHTDTNNSTACEMLIAKIYKKVKYALHITGTAHSLLYNITTRLSDNTDIQIKISKVHKMKRSNDYFGLFNNSIDYKTDPNNIKTWWNTNIEKDQKKNCYDIIKDYNENITKIITEIKNRPKTLKYNSLLISEEKIRINQFGLVDKIINDHADLFVVIFHGNCLRLYLSKNYEEEIKRWSEWDSKLTSTSRRLFQKGGVFGLSIDTEKSVKLTHNYCYFNIDTKILNIKFVYKLLRILFEKSAIPIVNKTVITITGKYGERGYSFTSDDYGEYSLHLTDQYFVSHASLNCTDISQRLRLQGKYNDIDRLDANSMKLTLWTTPELQEIIQNFYVKFIKEIEKNIMNCNNWEEIINILETIIDNGELKFGKYMKKLDIRSKRAGNITIQKHFDKKYNGYSLIFIDDMNDDEIREWCKETNLPEYECVNEFKTTTLEKFTSDNGEGVPVIEFIPIKNDDIPDINKIIKKYNEDNIEKFNKYKIKEIGPVIPKWITNRIDNKKTVDGIEIWNDNIRGEWRKYTKQDLINEIRSGLNNQHNQRIHLCYDTTGDLFLAIRFWNKNKKVLSQTTIYNKPKSHPHIIDGNNVIYSVFKKDYIKNNHGYKNDDDNGFIADPDGLPHYYYWKTLDGWLYYFNKDKPNVMSINIVATPQNKNIIKLNNSSEQLDTEPIIDEIVLLFTQSCCKKTDKFNLRYCLKDIYIIYELWCKINGKKYLKTTKKFKEEFEKVNYKEETSKGVDVNNKPGKRGYNIMVSL